MQVLPWRSGLVPQVRIVYLVPTANQRAQSMSYSLFQGNFPMACAAQCVTMPSMSHRWGLCVPSSVFLWNLLGGGQTAARAGWQLSLS